MILLQKNILIILFLTVFISSAQIKNGFHEFRYSNGNISSKGLIVKGLPEGYWINFYESGNIKSEGNRVENQLDSIWKFYDTDGILSVSLNFKKGVKQGCKITYRKDLSILKKEIFKSDTLQEIKTFYVSGKIKKIISFKNGLKDGNIFEYDSNGLEQVWGVYYKGKGEEYLINRKNQLNKRTGRWVKFSNGIVIKDVNYLRGLKDGYERIYNKKGELLLINKYKNGLLIKDFKKLEILEVKRQINNKGIVVKSGVYTKKGEPTGIHREYTEEGLVKSSITYIDGVILSKGIVNKDGSKEGYWVIFYKSGKKLGEGLFKNNNKYGKWIYYYENGLLESEGFYSLKGEQDSLWREYYSNGSLYEEINYTEGMYNGMYKVFDDSGRVLVQGSYKHDEEMGKWFYINGSLYESGSYFQGKKVGQWRTYSNKQLIFKGSFERGLPVGEHIYWYPSGNLNRIGKYKFGRKSGDWIKYTDGGKVLMVITYSEGLERIINGYYINPQHENEDYIEYEQTGYE